MVRIEAIKCFPCYVKVTFLQTATSPETCDVASVTAAAVAAANKVVNINLPGLCVDVATSRTKNHTYGLFWKNNRKRCCIYLAFDSAIMCETHLKWMRNSIQNLELHRREILETRRVSRFIGSKMPDESGAAVAAAARSVESSMCEESSRNATNTIKDLNDILGPLPAIPDSNVNWSRRVSGFSGIYEEISDPSIDAVYIRFVT